MLPCCFLQMYANAPTSPFLGSLPQSPGSRLRRRATFAISVSFFKVASRLPAEFTDVVPARMRAGIISAKSRILMLCSQAVCKCIQDTTRNPSRYMSKRIVSKGGKGCASGERQWASETAKQTGCPGCFECGSINHQHPNVNPMPNSVYGPRRDASVVQSNA